MVVRVISYSHVIFYDHGSSRLVSRPLSLSFSFQRLEKFYLSLTSNILSIEILSKLVLIMETNKKMFQKFQIYDWIFFLKSKKQLIKYGFVLLELNLSAQHIFYFSIHVYFTDHLFTTVFFFALIELLISTILCVLISVNTVHVNRLVT